VGAELLGESSLRRGGGGPVDEILREDLDLLGVVEDRPAVELDDPVLIERFAGQDVVRRFGLE